MSQIDREMLVAKTKATSNGGLFWVAVAALPVVGIAAGLVFGLMPSGGQATMHVAETAPQQVVPQVQPPVAETAPAFSARFELKRYQTVQATLRTCAQVGPAEHFKKAGNTYRELNAAKLEALTPMAMAEPADYDLSAFEKDIPTDPGSIMIQGMTGQLAANALQRSAQFNTMMSDISKRADGYLGEAPSLAECTQFRNEIISGKHNLRLS